VPRAPGASWSPPRATSRTRPRRWRGDKPCGRSSIARPHGVRLGATVRILEIRIVRVEVVALFSGRSGQPRVDSSTTASSSRANAGLSCVDEGDHGAGRRLDGERERAVSPVLHVTGRMTTGRPTRRCLRSSACWRVRPRVRCSSKPSRRRVILLKRTANESRHLRRYSSENQRDASIADQFRVCREFAPDEKSSRLSSRSPTSRRRSCTRAWPTSTVRRSRSSPLRPSVRTRASRPQRCAEG
jgi:hypothetical protein